MRPGHINVFDGLRITTEHMNYLQGSLHSAVQDLREILGLGAVYSGFEVVVEGNSINVSPGLAFDYQKNRIVSDEPKTIVVSFAANESTKYVSVKYDQIEDGKVEDRFTLVWDSCAIEVWPTLPPANANVVVIARIDKVGRNGSNVLQVTRLPEVKDSYVAPEVSGAQPPLPEGAEPGSETSPEVETKPQTDSLPNEGKIAGPASTAETPVTTNDTAVSSTQPTTGNENTTSANSAPSLPAVVLPPNPTTRVGQGVTRLAPAQGPTKLAGTILIDSLLKWASDPANVSELTILLAEADVPLSFPLLSLSCQTIISGSLTSNGGSAETGTSTFSTTAHGEFTNGREAVSQFGVSTTEVVSKARSESLPYRSDDLTENGIALLPLQTLERLAKNGTSASGLLQRLAFLIEIPKVDTSGFKVTCSLRCRGAVTREEIKEFQNKGYVFEWEARVAWKALGVSQ
jgi:hypothetical protein